MLACPACGDRLRREQDGGVVHRCARCGGVSMTVALVRRRGVDPRAVARVWQSVRGGSVDPQRACPHCRRPMQQAPAVDTHGDRFVVDGCVTCLCLWFDHGELEGLPEAEEQTEPELPAEARRLLAVAQVSRVRRGADDEAPVAGWQWVPMILGMPAELSSRPLNRLPLVTWTLAALCALALVATWSRLPEVIAAWGLIPTEWTRRGGLTLLTSFFLHGGLLHLLSNAYFLVVFGDNVEDLLGHGRFLALVVLSALAGDIAHGMLDPTGTIPVVGASGGIFGVVAFYAVSFPKARMGFLFYFRVVRVPVIGLVLLYGALQALGAYLQTEGIRGGVSHLAHIGGAVVGIAAGLWTRSQSGNLEGEDAQWS